MSREIKFRAWDDVAKKMYYGEAKQFDDMLGFRFRHFATEKPFYMQFTGLHDATTWEELTEDERAAWTRAGNMPSEWKGKEIYEGDIIDTFDYMGICVVHFISGCFVIEKSNDSALLGWPSIAQANSRYDTLCRGARGYKVVGNIHINPELLTVY